MNVPVVPASLVVTIFRVSMQRNCGQNWLSVHVGPVNCGTTELRRERTPAFDELAGAFFSRLTVAPSVKVMVPWLIAAKSIAMRPRLRDVGARYGPAIVWPPAYSSQSPSKCVGESIAPAVRYQIGFPLSSYMNATTNSVLPWISTL